MCGFARCTPTCTPSLMKPPVSSYREGAHGIAFAPVFFPPLLFFTGAIGATGAMFCKWLSALKKVAPVEPGRMSRQPGQPGQMSTGWHPHSDLTSGHAVPKSAHVHRFTFWWLALIERSTDTAFWVALIHDSAHFGGQHV